MVFTAALCSSTIRLAIFTVLPETVEYYYLMVSARFVQYAPFQSVGISTFGTPLVKLVVTSIVAMSGVTSGRRDTFAKKVAKNFSNIVAGTKNLKEPSSCKTKISNFEPPPPVGVIWIEEQGNFLVSLGGQRALSVRKKSKPYRVFPDKMLILTGLAPTYPH